MGRSTGVPESALIHVAVRTLGLSEVKPFDSQKAVIETRLTAMAALAPGSEGAALVAMTLAGFADELSSDSPAPGGGSVAAYAGALAAGLATMVANLSHPKRGFEAKQPALERIAVRGQVLKDRLLAAVDADTAAFDRYLAAMRMPKESAEERALRDAAIVVATIATIEVPLATLEACPEIVGPLSRNRRDRPPGLPLRRRHRRGDGAGGGLGRLPKRLHQSSWSRRPECGSGTSRPGRFRLAEDDRRPRRAR